MKAISTEKAPAAIGPYSQAIQVGNLVYTSGQIPIDPATGMIVKGGIKADMGDFADMNSVYAEFFTEPYPARSAVAVKTLPKGALVEIEVIAEVKA